MPEPTEHPDIRPGLQSPHLDLVVQSRLCASLMKTAAEFIDQHVVGDEAAAQAVQLRFEAIKLECGADRAMRHSIDSCLTPFTSPGKRGVSPDSSA